MMQASCATFSQSCSKKPTGLPVPLSGNGWGAYDHHCHELLASYT